MKTLSYSNHFSNLPKDREQLIFLANSIVENPNFDQPENWHKALAVCSRLLKNNIDDPVVQELYKLVNEIYDYTFSNFYLDEEAYQKWFEDVKELNDLFIESGNPDGYYKQYLHYLLARDGFYSIEKTREYLDEGVKKNQKDCKATIGNNFYYGINKFEKDPEKGLELLQEAYQKDSSLAGLHLFTIAYYASKNKAEKEAILKEYQSLLDENKGLHLKAAYLLELDEKAAALALLEKSIELKSSYSIMILGDQIYRGVYENLGFKPTEAQPYLQEAFEHGQYYSGFLLGQTYFYPPQGEPVDFDKALEFHKKAASYNQPHSLMALAKTYLYNPDYIANDKGLAYLDRAIDLDFSDAYAEKAYRLLDVMPKHKRNPHKAKEYLERAMEQGNPYAPYRLGYGYEQGDFGEKPDLKKAYGFYEIAAERNSQSGIEKVGEYNRFGYGIEQNLEKAIAFYQKGIDLYNSNFCKVEMAMMKEEGAGMEKDIEGAKKLYEEALKNNYPYAGLRLGYLYEYQPDMEQDLPLARQYYQEASEVGLTEATHNYARCLRYGIGGETDLELAVKLFEKAVEEHYLSAHVDLAMAYEYGIGGKPQNPEKAMEYMLVAAEAGIPYAQYKAGSYHMYDFIANAKLSEAKKWLEKAVENHSYDAMLTLGDFYMYGYGDEKDYDRAFPLYQLAAENEVYSEGLGLCYSYGIGTKKDDKKAFEYLEKGAKAGDVRANFHLGLCYYYGSGVKPDLIEAFYHLRYAADHNHLESMGYVGKMMVLGEGTARNPEEGVAFLKQGAEAHYDLAQYELGNCYLRGEGVPEDAEKAMKWYVKAAKNGNEEAQKIIGNKRRKRRRLW